MLEKYRVDQDTKDIFVYLWYNTRDLPKVTFLADAEGRSRRSKTFGFWPKAEAEGIKIGTFLLFKSHVGYLFAQKCMTFYVWEHLSNF